MAETVKAFPVSEGFFRDLTRSLPEKHRDRVNEAVDDYILSVSDDGLEAILGDKRRKNWAEARERIALVIADVLAEEYQVPASVALTRGLILYNLAMKAEAEGNRVTILDADDTVIAEVRGLSSEDPKLVTFSE